MSKKYLWIIASAVVIAAASTAAVQADDEVPAAGKLAPPPIHEPFAGPNLLPCKKGDETTPGIEGCVEHRILKGDRQIEGLNSSISAGLANARMQRQFVTAHRAWLTYRNVDCESRSSIYEGGTLRPLASAECDVDRNKQRIQDLREFRRALDG